MHTRPTLLLAFTTTFSLALMGGDALAEKPPVPVKCSKDKIKAVWAAKHGQFRIQAGMAEETRSGYVERRKLKLSSKCLLEVVPGDRVALIFDEKHKGKLRRSTGYQMQCVDAKKPTGKFLSYDAAPQADSADGKSWTPPCTAKALNKAEKKACSKGISNSERHSPLPRAVDKGKNVHPRLLRQIGFLDLHEEQ